MEKKCKYSSPQTRMNEESLVYPLTIAKQKLVRDSQGRVKFKGAHSKQEIFIHSRKTRSSGVSILVFLKPEASIFTS